MPTLNAFAYCDPTDPTCGDPGSTDPSSTDIITSGLPCLSGSGPVQPGQAYCAGSAPAPGSDVGQGWVGILEGVASAGATIYKTVTRPTTAAGVPHPATPAASPLSGSNGVLLIVLVGVAAILLIKKRA